jgi:hypothetical protein
MRHVLLVCLVTLALCSTVAAGPTKTRNVTSAGLQLTVPAGWHVDQNKLLSCDPQRLLLVSSQPIRTARTGGLLAPDSGQVLIFVMEDHANLPAGNLHRPTRFSVDWNRLFHLKGSCGTPDTPASMHWFHTQGRYLGLTIFPGPRISTKTRAQTIAVMDSLRVTGSFTLP